MCQSLKNSNNNNALRNILASETLTLPEIISCHGLKVCVPSQFLYVEMPARTVTEQEAASRGDQDQTGERLRNEIGALRKRRKGACFSSPFPAP